MTYISAKVDTSQFRGLPRALAREQRRGGGPIGQGFAAAGLVYMGFTRARYFEQSRGGGDWEPLAPSTLRGRRRGSRVQGARRANQAASALAARGVAPSNAAILIDTATLVGSITPGTHASEDIDGGIRVGTEVAYARYHQDGGPHLPQREIFVQPDSATLSRMGDGIAAGYQMSIDQYGAAR